MNSAPFATDDEIRYASSILLKPGECFLDDEQKVAIIRSNVSMDVKASPGSGKTTVLLAKLIILANRMPLEDGRGICVLTHTNVAIDEIKSKLGAKSDVLFRYPNFFGTIQSFVDRYFAIPSIKEMENGSSVRFDDDLYHQSFKREINRLGEFGSKTKNYLRARKIEDYLDFSREEAAFYFGIQFQNSRIEEMISYLKDKKMIKKTGRETESNFKYKSGNLKKKYITENIDNPKVREFLLKEKTRIDYKTNEAIQAGLEDGSMIQINYDCSSIVAYRMALCEESQQYIEIKTIGIKLHESGTYRYAHAYEFARERYMKYPQWRDAITSRFSHIFIDEMQDTNKYQSELIDSAFDEDKVIIQKFGDPLQAIYDHGGEGGTWNPSDYLRMDESHRFGQNIASVLRTVCTEDNRDLKANEKVNSLKPILLVFKDPTKVISKFGALITERKVVIDGEEMDVWEAASKENKRIKAIGHVSKKKEGHLIISNYFVGYEKPVDKAKFLIFDSLLSYISLNEGANPKQFHDQIANAILRLFNICEISREVDGKKLRYSASKLLEALQNKNPQVLKNFRELITVQCRILKFDTSKLMEVHKKLGDFLRSELLPLFIVVTSLPEQANCFIDLESSSESSSTVDKLKNTYIHDKEKAQKIEIATVHAVKGETHAATLYLETYNNKKYESELLAGQIAGNVFVPRPGDSQVRKLLKLAYVGMSRPRYLLCFAVHADRYEACLKASLENPGASDASKLWEVVYVD